MPILTIAKQRKKVLQYGCINFIKFRTRVGRQCTIFVGN
jgi:hypothetical protein